MDAVVETGETDHVLAAAVGVAVVGIVGSEILSGFIIDRVLLLDWIGLIGLVDDGFVIG